MINISKVYGTRFKPTYTNFFQSMVFCGFRKGFSAQHCLIAMIEKWHQSLDSRGQAAAVLIDLSKAFNCIDHELLIAKLSTYGFDNFSHIFIYSYLPERKQSTKMNSSFI